MKLGCHLSIAGGVHNAVLLANKLGLDCVAMFVRNQRQWHASAMTGQEIEAFHQARRETGISPVVAHGSYLVNLAGKPDIRAKSLVVTADELNRCGLLGVEYLVIHPGSSQIEQLGIEAITDGLCEIVAGYDLKTDWPAPMILLESTAGQGSCLGCSLEQLAKMLERLKPTERFGVCLDTCHLFTAGYDFRTAQQYESLIQQVDSLIGLSRVKAIHLNDSIKDFDTNVDRHAHIGKGKIGTEALARFVTDPRFTETPMILETPHGLAPDGSDLDEMNIATVRGMMK